jgi:hypothetical protein
MPNVGQMIKKIVQNQGVRQDIVEKDYALSYLLAAITETDELGANLVLKGGTALKKTYFQDYRFSENLDYSTRLIGPIQNIDLLMQTVIGQMALKLNERGPFQLGLEPFALNQPHPGDQKAYIIRVQFPEQRQPLCRLKVEITIDEPIIKPVELLPIMHGFPEEFSIRVPVYALCEITAEKLRALLQSRARLQERGWGASRVCRDYYDLWNLLRQPGICSPDLVPLLQQKCAVRNVHYESPADFIAEDLFAVVRNVWQQQLLPFVPNGPPVEQCLAEVKNMILSVWE